MAVDLGKLVAKDGWTYQFTPTDLLWMTRMAAFEGGNDPAEVLWTMAQAFSLHRRGTFTSFIQSYSQPINPKWLRSGSCCCGTGGGTCPRTPRCAEPECSAEVDARRRYIQSVTMGELARTRPRAVERTVAWVTARVPNKVPKAVEFANPRVSAGFLSRTPGSKLLKKSGNWFITTSRSRAADTGTLKVAFEGRTAGASSGSAGLVLVAGASALGYALWRRSRR
jgi:hypothetical protein